MAANRNYILIGRLLAAWMAVSVLTAAQYRGTVKSGGLPVPGATVTAIQGDQKITATTDDHGFFSFKDLNQGAWTIEIEMLGFAKAARNVDIGSAAIVTDWELKLLSQEALLASLKPAQPSVEPAAAAQARAPESNQGRTSTPMPAQSQAGKPTPPRAGQTAQRGFQRLNVNQSADATAFGNEGTIKSEEVADLNQTAANSFIVQGSMSSALGMAQQNDWEFGPRGMGMELGGGPGMMGMEMAGQKTEVSGPQIAMRSPGGPGAGGPPMGDGPPPGGGPGGPGGRVFFGGPGGRMGPGGPRGGPGWQGRPNAMAFGNARRNPRNSYMGSAFFSLNNSVWDARTYSVTGANLDKPAYASGRVGAMFGGPLQIPKLVSREKQILFTINFDVQRNRTGAISQPVNMPTALERSGDFSQTLVQGRPVTIYDPTTGLPFAGNQIPASRLDPAALALLKYFPNPNLPFAARNYQTSWTGLNNGQHVNARIMNLSIGHKDRLSGGIGYQGTDTSSPNLFGFVDDGSGSGVNANLAWSRTVNTHLTNNVHYSFSRSRNELEPFFANVENVAANLNIAGTSQDPRNWGPPNLSFTNYASLTDGNSSLNRNQTSLLGESLMWIRGSHTLVFGGDYRRQQFNQLADPNGRGAYSFTGSATSQILNGVAQTGTGYDLADFLLGLPSTGSIRYGNPDKYFRGAGYDLFVNEDWRINSRLSLVLGMRWDYASPMTELYDRLVNLDVASGFSAVAAVTPGAAGAYSGQLPSALIRPDWHNFSPRFGFAWRPRLSDSLVVRGGYGIYYNTSVYNIIASNMAQQPPFAQILNASSSPATPLTIENGFLLATSQSLMSTYAIDPNYRVGYAQTWTISVQHDLPLGMFGTVGYLGTKGTRLDQQFIPNSVPPGIPESLLPHGFIYETSNGNSIYHAAQFQLNRRFRSGIGAHASYQFSKSIDNAGTGGRGQGGTPVAQNWLDLAAERGLSSFDARHNLMLQMQYSTGQGAAGGTLVNGTKGALMKDWTISASISLHSGNPFTAVAGGNRSQVAGTAVTNTVRADATGLPIEAPGMLFNTAAFAAPLPGLWGTAGRNTIPGPATFYLNGALGRVIRIGERRSIDLQLQAQNLLNHVTITNWGTVLGANNFGLATSAAAMRKLTANVRFRF